MPQKSGAQQNVLRCFSCGSEMRKVDEKLDVFKCSGCGQGYDFGGFFRARDLETFERMFRYKLRRAA